MANALQAALNKAISNPTPPVGEVLAPEAPANRVGSPSVAKSGQGRAKAPSEETAPRRFHRPVRDGKRFVGGHFTPELVKQLRLLAAEDDTTIQSLLEEALDLLFVKKGKKKLAQSV